MKTLKYIFILLIALITLPLTGTFTSIPTWTMCIPLIIAGLYLILSFIHYHFYVININNKLQNKKAIKMPDTKSFKTILDITYGSLLVIFLVIVFFPIVTYPKDIVSINLPDQVDDINLQSIVQKVEDEIISENSTVYVLDQFRLGINEEKEITSCNFTFVVLGEGKSKTYTTSCKNNKMTIRHDYYSPETPYYRLEYTLDDIVATFEVIDFDELVSNYNLAENETIYISTWFGYSNSDTFTMKPASSIDHMFEYHLDGTIVEITQETEYNKSQYYVISTFSKNDGEYYDLMSLQYTYIVEYE